LNVHRKQQATLVSKKSRPKNRDSCGIGLLVVVVGGRRALLAFALKRQILQLLEFVRDFDILVPLDFLALYQEASGTASLNSIICYIRCLTAS
jgi:hypothetical protein